VKAYHRTNAGEAILRDGFEDGSQIIGGREYCGVWISEAPFDDEYGDQLLSIELPEAVFAEYEWGFAFGYREAHEPGTREALIPAEILNRYPRASGPNTGPRADSTNKLGGSRKL
jgi:hypothetical protein